MESIDRPGAAQWIPEGADIHSLRAASSGCRGCELWQPATQVVFSAGPPDAPVMLVGEQPGDQEDRGGQPFVGPAGRVLVDALRAAGLDTARLYVTNAVKHFRFEQRGARRIHKTPGVEHVTACRPWLAAELARVDPRLVVALGATAGRAVFGRAVRIGAERGRITEVDGRQVLLTTHPSAVLRVRDTPDWEQAFGSFVADLRLAAPALT